MSLHRSIGILRPDQPRLFSLPYAIKTRVRNFVCRGLSRLVETGTRGTLLSITALIGSYVILFRGATHVVTHVREARAQRSFPHYIARFLISRAIIRHTRGLARDFYFYFGVTARRHIKEINRGMRPPRPRRIFTRLEEMG